MLTPLLATMLTLTLATQTGERDDSMTSEQQARELTERGLEARGAAKNDEALRYFNEAYLLAPSPRLRAQIGLALCSLNRWIEAESAIKLALEQESDPWIAANRAPIEQTLSLAQNHIGDLIVQGEVGAVLEIEGREIGKLPIENPIRLVEGTYRIELRAWKMHTYSSSVEIVGRKQTVHSAKLVYALETPGPTDLTEDPTTPDVSRRRWWQHPAVPAALFVGSAASFAAGAYYLSIDGDRIEGTLHAYESSNAAYSWFAGGAVTAILGGFTLYEALTWNVTPTGNGVSVSGRF